MQATRSAVIVLGLLIAAVVAGMVGTVFVLYHEPTVAIGVLAIGVMAATALVGARGRRGWTWSLWLGVALVPSLVAAILALGVIALLLLGLPGLAACAIVVALFALVMAVFIHWFPGTAETDDDRDR